MLWISYPDRVDRAERAKVFIWRQFGPARRWPYYRLRVTLLGHSSHAGVFRGTRISSLSKNNPSTENNIPTLQILEDWPWRQANPIITPSAWNTGKAWWPLINARLGAAKVRLSQTLEYSVHCITLEKERKVTLVSRFYTTSSLWVVFSLWTLYFKTANW